MSDTLKIFFEKPFFKNFDQLDFIENENIIYYDNSHMNYIYKEKIENIDYTFYGFFKDSFFVIICDSTMCGRRESHVTLLDTEDDSQRSPSDSNSNLNINYHTKYVVLIKFEWILKKIDDDKSLWIIDNTKKEYTLDSMILPFRNKIFSDQNINIEDYIKMINFKIIKIRTSQKFKKSIFKNISKIFNFSNKEIYGNL